MLPAAPIFPARRLVPRSFATDAPEMDDYTSEPAQPAGNEPPAPPFGIAAPPPPTDAVLPPMPHEWGSTPVQPAPVVPKRRLGVLVAAVVVAAVVVFAVVKLTGGSSSRLPDSFAGAERVDSGPIADVFDSFSDSFSELGMQLEFAIYGGEFDPLFMIMTMQGDAVAAGGDLSSQFQQGFVSGMGADVDMSAAIEDSIDGVDYVCVPATGAQFSSIGGRVGLCLYQDGDLVAMVMSLKDDQLNALLQSTMDLHDQLAG